MFFLLYNNHKQRETPNQKFNSVSKVYNLQSHGSYEPTVIGQTTKPPGGIQHHDSYYLLIESLI